MSRIIENTLLGEAGGGTRKQRFDKMVRALSSIAVRAAQTGETWEAVAAGPRQYAGYNKPAKGSGRFRDLARQAIAYVTEHGPTIAANYYATPDNVQYLPDRLTPVTKDIFGNEFDDDHLFFVDTEMRPIKTKNGSPRLKKPVSDVLADWKAVVAPAEAQMNGNLPDTAPSPAARPISSSVGGTRTELDPTTTRSMSVGNLPDIAPRPTARPAIAPRTGSLDQRNEREIASLHPAFRDRARDFLAEARKRGLDLSIVPGQGYRTAAEQNALYAQDRTKPGKRVTDVPAGYSFHNYGIAFDVAPSDILANARAPGASDDEKNWSPGDPRWGQIESLARDLGFERLPGDLPHVQAPGFGRVVTRALRNLPTFDSAGNTYPSFDQKKAYAVAGKFNPTSVLARSMRGIGLLGLDGRTAQPAEYSPAPSRMRPDNLGYGPAPRPVDMASRRVASAFDDPSMWSITPRGIGVSMPVTPAAGYAAAMSFANDPSTRKADRLGLHRATRPGPFGFDSVPVPDSSRMRPDNLGYSPALRPLDVASQRITSAFGDPSPSGIEVSRPVTPAGGYADPRAPVMAAGTPRSLMDNVALKEWGASLPPGADPRLSGLSVYSPEGLAARIAESRALDGDMRGPSGPVPGLTQDDIDAVMNARASGPDPAEMAARIAAYKDPSDIAAAHEADRMRAARRANEALSSYTTAATPRAPSIRQQAYEANQATAGSIPGMLAAMDALGRPRFAAPTDDTRREAIEEARAQARITPYDRAKIPHVVTSTRFAPDLQPIAPTQPEMPAPGPTPTYAPEPAPAMGVHQLNDFARQQPIIAAPARSTPAAPRDMRNVFLPAPLSPPSATRLDTLGPALRQAILGGLVGGLPGAAIALAGGLLGRPGGLLGGLGPGFDAAVRSRDRFSTGSGLGGIVSAMGGPRGATGYSLSNPGMSYTSLGGNLGGLRRSEKYGWTEHVAPDGSVTGISYDNGGGGLLGGLSRGLGSLFGGSDKGKAGMSKAGKASIGKGKGGLY